MPRFFARAGKSDFLSPDLQNAGESAWEELKQGVESSWEVWKASFSRAKTAFEKGYQEGRTDTPDKDKA